MENSNSLITLIQGDARNLAIVDNSIHCVVTSPPYWQQRVYKGVGDAGIGLEPTIDEYLKNLLTVFREVRRVLRNDGLLWVNMGIKRGKGLGLIGMPEKFALCMQADGWVWRDSILFTKSS